MKVIYALKLATMRAILPLAVVVSLMCCDAPQSNVGDASGSPPSDGASDASSAADAAPMDASPPLDAADGSSTVDAADASPAVDAADASPAVDASPPLDAADGSSTADAADASPAVDVSDGPPAVDAPTTCARGFADCDRSTSNGCEADLSSDASNCGSCGHACAGGEVCTGGACVDTCGASPFVCGDAMARTATSQLLYNLSCAAPAAYPFSTVSGVGSSYAPACASALHLSAPGGSSSVLYYAPAPFTCTATSYRVELVARINTQHQRTISVGLLFGTTVAIMVNRWVWNSASEAGVDVNYVRPAPGMRSTPIAPSNRVFGSTVTSDADFFDLIMQVTPSTGSIYVELNRQGHPPLTATVTSAVAIPSGVIPSLNIGTDGGDCAASRVPIDADILAFRATPGLYARTPACPASRGDCDGNLTNGCEVDIATNNANCGACGNACGSGRICTAGVCEIVCPSGQTRCGDVCRDLSSDASNCGSCGRTCRVAERCVGSVCVVRQTSCASRALPGCGLVPVTGGTFTMGADAPALRASPTHPVTVRDFSLDAYEVTVARFREFWAVGHPSPGASVSYPAGPLAWSGTVTEPVGTAMYGGTCNWSASPGAREAHPINCVNWWTAQAFCVWDGGRLPTEAEWEYAARGVSDGRPIPRVFPWGDDAPLGGRSAPCDRAQFNTCAGEDGANTRRVGSFAPTGGFYDLAGNVWEMTADFFSEYTDTGCWGTGPRTDPLCTSGSAHTDRGGWWGNPSDTTANNTNLLRSATRGYDPPSASYEGLGFRCARSR